MFTKYTIALSALILVGGTAVAIAYEEPESKIGDRYPSLEQIDRSAPQIASSQRTMVQRNAKLNLYVDEDVDSKIADRYPLLEQVTPPTATASMAYRGVIVQRNAKLDPYTNEDPESKISDRYPFLEQTITTASAAKPTVHTMRVGKASTGRQKASLVRQGTQGVY